MKDFPVSAVQVRYLGACIKSYKLIYVSEARPPSMRGGVNFWRAPPHFTSKTNRACAPSDRQTHDAFFYGCSQLHINRLI